MAVTSIANKVKSGSLLVGNTFYMPSSFESIQTYTGSLSTVTFSSIPSTYKHLQVRIFGGTSGTSDCIMRFNSDTTNTNYATHQFYAISSGTPGSGFLSGSNYPPYIDAGLPTNAQEMAVIDILDYANTSKYKTAKTTVGYDTNSAGRVGMFSNLWMSTSAIDTITFSGRNWTNASFALYGIRG